MKKLIFPISILLMLTLLAGECGKEDLTITYPENGRYGENILRESDLDVITRLDFNRPKYYSLAAEIPKDNSLRVVMKNRSSDQSSAPWHLDSLSGWTTEGLEGISETLTATGPASCDLQIRFFYPGVADIVLYENGSEDTTRYLRINWHY